VGVGVCVCVCGGRWSKVQKRKRRGNLTEKAQELSAAPIQSAAVTEGGGSEEEDSCSGDEEEGESGEEGVDFDRLEDENHQDFLRKGSTLQHSVTHCNTLQHTTI